MHDHLPGRAAELWERYRAEGRAFRCLATSTEREASQGRARFERYRLQREDFSRICRQELLIAGAQAHAAGGEADRVRRLVADLGASGDFVADVLRLIEADRGRGETGRALAYSLRDTAATREVGELAVGLLAAVSLSE